MLAGLCYALTGFAAVGADGAVALRRSEVVFMGPKEVDIYRAYNATMVSWGGFAHLRDAKGAERLEARVKAAHELGLRYSVGLAFRTAFADMIEFDPKFEESVTGDLDGQPILVPWLWDHQHKGHPAYWFCTNSPGYRAYLKDQTRRAVTGAPDGLHIDDYAGTSGCPGGCFCRHCLDGFTAWLKAHAKPDELKAAGVESLDGFDYAAFLKGRGATAEDVRKKRWQLPLNALYETFQLQASRDFVAEIRRYAEELRGGPLLMSVNSSGGSAQSLVIAPVIDYFCGEVGHQAAREKVPAEPVFVAKMADALGKGLACTASGQDWAFVDEQKRPGLVRTWIAQLYAFGHGLMAPHRQWAYTATKGTHWYQSQPSDFAHLYRFVREHADLFDGYRPVARVALVYSNRAFRGWRRGAIDAAGWLAERSVPFELALAGDDWLDAQLTAEQLARYDAVVVPEPNWLSGAQAEALKTVEARVVTWPEKPTPETIAACDQRLRELAAPVTISADQVAVVLRQKPDAPLVCHLLNRDYRGSSDEVEPKRDVVVTIPAALLAGRRVTRATARAPGAEAKPLPVETTADGLRFVLPELGLWTVVALD